MRLPLVLDALWALASQGDPRGIPSDIFLGKNVKLLTSTLVVDNDRQCTMYTHTQLSSVPQS